MVNVLCLHGCRQTQEMFQGILEPYVRIGKKIGVNFFFCEGRYDYPEQGKMWLPYVLDLSAVGKVAYQPELLQAVMDDLDFLIKQYDISILLGFSQGANIVDTYCQYRRNPKIQKVILLSGYSFVDSNRTMIPIPCLNVVSKGDSIVPKDLAPRDYLSVKEITHDKGHKVPVKTPIVKEILDFCLH